MTGTIRVPAERSALPKVRGCVDGVLDALPGAILEQTRNEIRLAVEEIFVNIADYAYEGKAGCIVVTCITKNRGSFKMSNFETTTAENRNFVARRARNFAEPVQNNRFCNWRNVAYVTKNTETVFVTFADRGIPFNPLLAPEPDLNALPEERKNGGFGIFMVKNLMDVIEYEREDGWNKLTIGKRMRRVV